jgi:hypothetical protein
VDRFSGVALTSVIGSEDRDAVKTASNALGKKKAHKNVVCRCVGWPDLELRTLCFFKQEQVEEGKQTRRDHAFGVPHSANPPV